VSWERARVARGLAALGAAATAGLVAWACGSLSEPPTQPEPTQSVAPSAEPNPNPTPTPVFGAPAPRATPTPEPSPAPSPAPTPTPGNPSEGASECGSPTPPDLSRITVNVHLRTGDYWLLDSTPLVGPDWEYCANIGFTDGRSFCAVRPEGNPQRSACELYVTGRATDTGRPGPTWHRNGNRCTGRASGCENVPENQFQLLAYASGTYTACGKNGVCGEIEVDK
jgi:hypothetical protein